MEGKGCRDAGGQGRLTGNELYAGSELYASEFSCDNSIWWLDHISPMLLDNSYYINLVKGQGFLASDQEMYSAFLGNILMTQIIKDNNYNFNISL